MDTEKLLQQLQAVSDPELGEKSPFPNRDLIIKCLHEAQAMILPGFFDYKRLHFEELLDDFSHTIYKEIEKALKLHNDSRNANDIISGFLEELPEIKRVTLTDIQAIYDGDPAAKSKQEVIICYPGFYAIFVYRIAHVFYRLDVPIIPRIMSEYVHNKTGIDINPGATIGDYFCIDHGTGVVIGETSVIGSHVKLYQGVTIGAKSFKMDENGNPVKGGKRHPNIGNNVVIYANATILGGDTTIEDDVVIGGNSWITDSVEAGSKITG